MGPGRLKEHLRFYTKIMEVSDFRQLRKMSWQIWANLERWTPKKLWAPRKCGLKLQKREDYKTKLQESMDPRGIKLDPLCLFERYIDLGLTSKTAGAIDPILWDQTMLSHPQPASMA